MLSTNDMAQLIDALRNRTDLEDSTIHAVLLDVVFGDESDADIEYQNDVDVAFLIADKMV